jgi:hypothetical protein
MSVPTAEEILAGLKRLEEAVGPERFDTYLEAERRVREQNQRCEVLAALGAPLDCDEAATIAAARSWLEAKLGLEAGVGSHALAQAFFSIPRSDRDALMPVWSWLVARKSFFAEQEHEAPDFIEPAPASDADLHASEEGNHEPEAPAPAASPSRPDLRLVRLYGRTDVNFTPGPGGLPRVEDHGDSSPAMRPEKEVF